MLNFRFIAYFSSQKSQLSFVNYLEKQFILLASSLKKENRFKFNNRFPPIMQIDFPLLTSKTQQSSYFNSEKYLN